MCQYAPMLNGRLWNEILRENLTVDLNNIKPNLKTNLAAFDIYL